MSCKIANGCMFSDFFLNEMHGFVGFKFQFSSLYPLHGLLNTRDNKSDEGSNTDYVASERNALVSEPIPESISTAVSGHVTSGMSMTVTCV